MEKKVFAYTFDNKNFDKDIVEAAKISKTKVLDCITVVVDEGGEYVFKTFLTNAVRRATECLLDIEDDSLQRYITFFKEGGYESFYLEYILERLYFVNPAILQKFKARLRKEIERDVRVKPYSVKREKRGESEVTIALRNGGKIGNYNTIDGHPTFSFIEILAEGWSFRTCYQRGFEGTGLREAHLAPKTKEQQEILRAAKIAYLQKYILKGHHSTITIGAFVDTAHYHYFDDAEKICEAAEHLAAVEAAGVSIKCDDMGLSRKYGIEGLTNRQIKMAAMIAKKIVPAYKAGII